MTKIKRYLNKKLFVAILFGVLGATLIGYAMPKFDAWVIKNAEEPLRVALGLKVERNIR